MKSKSQNSKIKSYVFFTILISYASLLGNQWRTYTNANFVNDMIADSINIYCATRGGFTVFSKQDSLFSRIYTNIDGLPSNRVNCLLFDKHQNIWIGTNRGIVIYDKVLQSFARYRDLGSVEQNYINCLEVSGDTILAGTQNGLVIIDTKGTTAISDDVIISRMLPIQISCKVFALAVKDDFWISACPGLVKLSRDLQNTTLFLSPFGDSVKAMIVVNDSLYITSEQGIARYNGNNFDLVVLFDQRYSVFDLEYYSNKFYVATTSGLLEYDGVNLRFIFNEDTRAILFSDSLWIGAGGLTWFGGGLRLYQDNNWQEFRTNGLTANIVSCAISDKNGTIYAMHYPVGYKTVSRKTVSGNWQLLNDTIANNYVATVDNNNCIWFGHWILNGGLSCYNPANQSWQAKIWSGLKGVVGALGIDNYQVKWFHNQANTIIAVDNQNNIYEFTIPGLARPERHGYELVFDSQNRMWLGSSSGLVMFDYNNTFANVSDDIYQFIPYYEINSVAIDSRNRVWCATDQGAAVLDGDTFRIYNINNTQNILSNQMIRIRTDSWGGVWMLCSQGLIYYNIYSKQWHNYTSSNSSIIANEENDDKFYQWLFIDESNGNLLISTKEGISQYSYRVLPPPILTQVKIYPNPYISSQHEVITFDSLPNNAKVRVYGLEGDFICELSPNVNYSAARWSPKYLPTGVYIALVIAGDKRQIVKFAIIN